MKHLVTITKHTNLPKRRQEGRVKCVLLSRQRLHRFVKSRNDTLIPNERSRLSWTFGGRKISPWIVDMEYPGNNILWYEGIPEITGIFFKSLSIRLHRSSEASGVKHSLYLYNSWWYGQSIALIQGVILLFGRERDFEILLQDFAIKNQNELVQLKTLKQSALLKEYIRSYNQCSILRTYLIKY